MATYFDQILRLWDEWIAQTNQLSGNPDEFVEWANANGRFILPLQDMKKLMRKQVGQALRQAKKYDEEGGFTYRAKQSVTLFNNEGIPIKHYFDTDKGGTPTLRQKSVRERRDAIAHDVYRAVCDVERMNKVFPEDPQLSFVLEFADDVAEHRAAELAQRDNDEDEEAA